MHCIPLRTVTCDMKKARRKKFMDFNKVWNLVRSQTLYPTELRTRRGNRTHVITLGISVNLRANGTEFLGIAL